MDFSKGVSSKCSSKPVDDRGKVNENQEVEVQFSYRAPILRNRLIHWAVKPRISSVAPGRDARHAAAIINPVADMIAIKTAISNNAFTGQKDDILDRNCVASLPEGQSR